MTPRFTFPAVAWKNVLRRPSRSLLTIAGVATAVAAVVTLLNVVWGFERTWQTAYAVRGADLLVGRLTSRRPLPAPFPGDIAVALRTLPDVEEAAGSLMDLISVEEAPAMLVAGWELDSFLWNHIQITQGRRPGSTGTNEAALGVVAAQVLGKSVGDQVQIDTLEFLVCGIFTSAATSENGTILTGLPQLQALSGRQGQVNSISIKLRPRAGPEGAERVRQAVRGRFPGFSVFTVSEIVQTNLAIQAGKAVSLAVALIALAIGTVGVMNTMLMSVFERVQEIAVLLAMGWQRRRIVRLVLLESLVLSAAGGIAGSVVGVAALNALQSASWFRGKVDATASIPLLGVVLALTLALGAAAGIYPAWISTRMRPADGLRHE